MTTVEYRSEFLLKIGGRNVPRDLMDDLADIVVDSSLHLPDMFTILVRDPMLRWVDDPLLDIGREVEIRARTGEWWGGQEGLLIQGEITALEPRFSGTGETTVLVRGYDKSHRLLRGRKTRTFLKRRDSELARQIAGEAELAAEVDNTTVTYDYLLQNNQTNMEFLLARAERIGYQVFVSEGKLHFRKGDFSRGEGPELELGENLLSFQPCWTASGQADRMTVRSWDPKSKRAISSQAAPSTRLNQGGMTQTGGAKVQSAFSSAEASVTDRPVFTPEEATALATGLSHDISREFVQAEGLCHGHPGIQAGWKVTIKNVGKRFSGKYFITSATHTYDAEGYRTQFSIAGRQPNTLSHLLDSGNGRGSERGQMEGVVTALVTNLNDPDNLGRVKVKYAWLGEIESDWVRIASPMAGAGRGFFCLPEVNDEVLIAFEHGDVHRPYIVGGLWSNMDKPPLTNSAAVEGGKVTKRLLRTRSGHEILLDDTDGEEQIVIRDRTAKNEIVINSKNNTLSVKVGKDITVEAQGRISVKSVSDDLTFEGRNMSIRTQQNFSLEAIGSCTLQGTRGLTITNAVAQVALNGPTVNVNNGALEVI